MITLKQNLEDAILFALLDAKMPQNDAHYYSHEIGPQMAEWVRNYFVWFIKGHSRNMQGEIRKEFDLFKQMVKRRVGEDGMIIDGEENETL